MRTATRASAGNVPDGAGSIYIAGAGPRLVPPVLLSGGLHGVVERLKESARRPELRATGEAAAKLAKDLAASRLQSEIRLRRVLALARESLQVIRERAAAEGSTEDVRELLERVRAMEGRLLEALWISRQAGRRAVRISSQLDRLGLSGASIRYTVGVLHGLGKRTTELMKQRPLAA